MQVLRGMEVERVVVVGWRLGGRIGLKLVELLRQEISGPPSFEIDGLMLIDTSPGAIWDTDVLDAAYGNRDGGREESWMSEAVRRVDPRFRQVLSEELCEEDGKAVDERPVFEDDVVKGLRIAVVYGAEEDVVDLAELENVNLFPNVLFEGKCIKLDSKGSSPFWEDVDSFMPVLTKFVKCC